MRDFHSLLCLTSDNLNISHAEQIRILIEEGARFIQIRSKKKSKNDLIKQINEVAEFVIKNEVMLIVNDFVDIANMSSLNGVHLGSDDCSVKEARDILGDQAIVGSTVHNFEEAKIVKELDLCDYVGLGPFRISKTKFDLEPFLSTDEIRKITEFLAPIPVFLIGGVSLRECRLLHELNLAGLAICSALSSNEKYGCYVKNFINQIPNREYVSS